MSFGGNRASGSLFWSTICSPSFGLTGSPHAKARKPVIELGNINVARDFSDVRAVVDSYARLLVAPNAIGGVFNVCSGQAYALREVIDLVSRISGHTMEIRVNPAFVRADA